MARIAALPVLTAGVLAAALLGGCSATHSSTGSSASSTTPTTTTTSTVAAPTTTAAPPAAPQPTAEGAAITLVGDWASGNRAAALMVATQAAVAALFAHAYRSGLVDDRGCSAGSPPVTCTFGPPGGGDPNDPIYQLSVIQAPAGTWYVDTVQVEG